MTRENILDEAASFENGKRQSCRFFALLASLVMLAPAAAAPCSDCGVRTAVVAADKPAAESRPADEPGTLRMHAPAARFFRTRRSSSVALKDEYARI